MPILAVVIAEGFGPLVFKAPIRTMYKIHSFYGIINFAGNNSVRILNYAVEDDFVIGAQNEGLIFAIEADSGNISALFVLPVPEITKWITIHRSSGTAFTGTVFMNYELVKATRTELLIEWFRKGR